MCHKKDFSKSFSCRRRNKYCVNYQKARHRRPKNELHKTLDDTFQQNLIKVKQQEYRTVYNTFYFERRMDFLRGEWIKCTETCSSVNGEKRV